MRDTDRDTKPKHAMKIKLKTATAALGLLAFGLLASSCAHTSPTSGGTHQMGPPGKDHPVSNEAHPHMAR